MMSEKFGLNWPNYDAKRVQYLLAVASAYVERDNISSTKTYNHGR